MSRFLLPVILFSFISTFTIGQDLSEIKWLHGNWISVVNDKHYTEQWAFISPVQMIGNGTESTGRDTISHEQLKIFKRDQRYFYAAKVNGNDFVEFEIIDLHKNGFTAINLSHDFPQRIIYSKINKRSFNARVEAGDGSNLKGFDLRYQKSRNIDGFRMGVSSGGIGIQF